MSRLVLRFACAGVALGAWAGALRSQTGPARPAATAPAATATAPATTKAAELAIAESDNGKTLHLAVGRTAAISLAGNATTGYSWSLTKLDGTALEQAGSVEYAPDRLHAVRAHRRARRLPLLRRALPQDPLHRHPRRRSLMAPDSPTQGESHALRRPRQSLADS